MVYDTPVEDSKQEQDNIKHFHPASRVIGGSVVEYPTIFFIHSVSVLARI